MSGSVVATLRTEEEAELRYLRATRLNRSSLQADDIWNEYLFCTFRETVRVPGGGHSCACLQQWMARLISVLMPVRVLYDKTAALAVPATTPFVRIIHDFSGQKGKDALKG